ncbi:MAG: hypothetical protein AAGD14_09305 [Planctomycetota bacterium]
MARGVPDAMQMREIKYGAKTTPAAQQQTAAALLQAGRVAESLDLSILAGDDAAVASIRKRACDEGRPIWLIMIERAHSAIPTDEWRACAEAAFRAERWRDAFRAFTRADDEAGLERVREKIPGYEIYVPDGK